MTPGDWLALAVGILAGYTVWTAASLLRRGAGQIEIDISIEMEAVDDEGDDDDEGGQR